MRTKAVTQYVGALVRPTGSAGRTAIRLLDSQLGNVAQVGAWHTYEIVSEAPLANEVFSGPFTYRVYALFGKALGAIIAVEGVLAHVRDEVLREVHDELRGVTVDVDGVVDDIAAGRPYVYTDRLGDERTMRFLLSYVHARTPGLGVDIKSLSIYGENISNGRVFREHRSLFNISTCGVRRTSTKEIVKVGADGALTIRVNSRWVEQRLLDLTHVMGYLVSRRRVLDTSQPALDGKVYYHDAN